MVQPGSCVTHAAHSFTCVPPYLAPIPRFIALNRHPAMYELYGAYLDAFVRAGMVGTGRPYMQFVSTAHPTQYGSWGLQVSLMQYSVMLQVRTKGRQAGKDWHTRTKGSTWPLGRDRFFRRSG